MEIDKEKKTQHHGEVDRITDLPDGVRLHIISLLPIQTAVAMCILSRRWKDVWIGIKSLDLSECSVISSTDYPSFKIFLDKIRLSKDAYRVEFVKFYISAEMDGIHASAWITSMMKRGIRKLVLGNGVRRRIFEDDSCQVLSLPDGFFTSPELVDLKLCGKLSICLPHSLHFPLVKVICMSNIHFKDGGSIKNLLSGCPILETLNIEHCDGEGNIDLHSSSLKTLRISDHFWSSGNISIDAPILDNLSFVVSMSHCVIRAPNVRELFLCASNITNYCLPNMPSLVKAYLDIGSDGEKVSETLHKVSSSKFLMLGASTMLSLEDNNHRLPIFSNLTRLEVMMFNWPAVLHSLESSPGLKCLIAYFMKEELEWSYPPFVPECMHVLEEVQIRLFDGSDFTWEFMEYILSNAKILKRMVVRVDVGFGHEIENIKEDLEMFPRVCLECEIEVF